MGALTAALASGLSTKAAVPVTGYNIGSGYGGFLGGILEPFAGAWQRNIVAEPLQTVLAFSAVSACVSLISNDIAKLRPRIMQEDADGTSTEVSDSQYTPFQAVLDKPNAYQTHVQFFAYWLVCKLLYGNCYVIKQRDNRGGPNGGVVRRLHILDPRRVVPLVTDDGGVYYQIGADRLAGYQAGLPAAPASEIIHDRMPCFFHPLVGVSPIYACGSSATQGMRIQNNSARFFENMSRPSGQLTAPGNIPNETADRLKKDFEAKFSGSAIGRLFVAGSGLKYEPMTMPATDSQLIEQLKWTVEDVARAFHMPLHKIQAPSERATQTVVSQDQGYYSQTLQIHVESMECLLTEGLELPKGKSAYCVEFDESGLSRMDPLSRMQTYQAGVGAGVMAPNEGRRAEGWKPVTGGDTPYLQEQNWSLEMLSLRPQPTAAQPAPAPDDTPANDPSAKDFNVYEGEYIEDAIGWHALKESRLLLRAA